MTFDYAVENQVQSIPDLIKMSAQLTLGGPPQFQQSPTGLPALQSTYGVVPSAFKPLELGSQYQALDQGTVQAAVVQTTDPQLLSGSYPLLHDPEDMFGWGNIVPVASVRGARRGGPGVRGDDQPGQRAADVAGDARAERGGGARRSGSRGRRDRSSSRRQGLVAAALDRRRAEHR